MTTRRQPTREQITRLALELLLVAESLDPRGPQPPSGGPKPIMRERRLVLVKSERRAA